MPLGKYANVAAEGDTLTRVTCACGSLWVRPHAAEDWRCRRCHQGETGESVKLGPGGTLPS